MNWQCIYPRWFLRSARDYRCFIALFVFFHIFLTLHNTCTIIHVKNINYLNYGVNNLILKAITQIPISTSNPVIHISLNPILCVVGGSQDSASLVLFSGWSCIWKQKVVGTGQRWYTREKKVNSLLRS